MLGKDNLKVHLDSYHMNIEENNFYKETKLSGEKLIHYYLCENHRGSPGSGLVSSDGIFRVLSEIYYKDYAVSEVFVENI